MTPEERLNAIIEEQRSLRERMEQLSAQIAVTRMEVQNLRKASAVPLATSLTPSVAPAASVTTAVDAVSTPPPLPGVLQPTVKPPQEPKPESINAASSAAATASPVAVESPVTPVVKPPVIPAKPVQPPVVDASKGDFEMRLGKVWFVRIGIVAILTGLALASVYAYKNFIHNTPPIFKIMALYAVSGALAGLGIWLERSRESLKTFGRVITAGGLAAVYYTTYAMHYVERLRVVESPMLAGLLLLVCALGIFFYSDRRKDQTVASMALVLGYYGTAINPVGWFSLFSNLILSAGGLWLLWRNKWVAIGVLSLVGAYGGFGFWQYALPLLTSGNLAPMDYWAGQGFLISCWVLFSAAFVFAATDTLKAPVRVTLVSFNNGAFGFLFVFALLAKTPLAEQPHAFFQFSMVWGAVLLALCWVVEKLHKEHGRALSETFLAFGIATIGFGLVVKLSGYQRLTAFAFQSALLAWLGSRQKRWVASISSVLLSLFVVLLALGEYIHFVSESPSRSTIDILQSVLQAALILLAGWFLRGFDQSSGLALQKNANLVTDHTSSRPLSWLSLVLCFAAFLVWMLTSLLPLDAWWKPTVLLLVCGLLGYLGRLSKIDLRELTLTARVAGLFSAFVIVYFSIIGKTPASLSLEILGGVLNIVLLSAGAWFARHRPVFGRQAGDDSLSWTAVCYSLAALLSFTFIMRQPFDPDWKPAIWVVLCALMVVSGKLVRVPELSLVPALISLLMSWHQVTGMHVEAQRTAALLVMLAFGLLTLAAWWPARGGWTGWGVWQERLRWLAAMQLTVSYLHWWSAHEPEYFSLVTVIPALLLAIFARWKEDSLALRWALILAVLALVKFDYDVLRLSIFASSAESLIKMPWWAWLIPVLAMILDTLLRGSVIGRQEVYKLWINFLAVVAVISVWLYLTFEVLEDGHFRTMAWAGLALVLFVFGIVLGNPVYRRAGLAILALAIGRIVFYDVWQLETAARFISFLVIGAVLVALGFFYNRFEDFIRKYL